MRILVTNDDGIHADGLAALEAIAAQLSEDVWVCAPEVEQSGASRALSLSAPVRVQQLGPRRFATNGTPTDCVMLAIHDIIGGPKPDLVLSGVNRGANLAEDVTLSGTVAGAIEGMVQGVPGIALSQTGGPQREDYYEPATAFAPGIIARLIKTGWPADVVININFPNRDVAEIEAVEVTRQGFRDVHIRHTEKRTDLRGKAYFWIGYHQTPSQPDQGTDLRAIYEGRISVTPLHIDLTHAATVHALKGVLGGAPPKL